jgi:predicted ATPase
MITKLFIRNFRSILGTKEGLDLGKITVLTGPNNSGKSSVIYGLLALKNIVLNPNQSLDSFLNLGFVNLGGFAQSVYLKREASDITLGVEVTGDNVSSQYTASFGKKVSSLSVQVSKPYPVSLSLDVSFPYPGNKNVQKEIAGSFGKVRIVWNGVSPTVNVMAPPSPRTDGSVPANEETGRSLNDLNKSISEPLDEVRAVDFVPLRRGFTKPIYSSVPLQPQLLNEDELATVLATNRDLEGKVAQYLEQMVDRVFSVRTTAIGTANFALQSRDRSTGLVSDLVNEGFGTNQLVTILTKALREEMRTICIEECEIHLHPALMDKLVDVLVQIVQDEDKNFIISTHSEHIVLSLLNKVAKGKLRPEDVCIYYLYKKGRDTVVERQEVNEKGQVKGGLKGFYETQLKQIKEFFSVP